MSEFKEIHSDVSSLGKCMFSLGGLCHDFILWTFLKLEITAVIGTLFNKLRLIFLLFERQFNEHILNIQINILHSKMVPWGLFEELQNHYLS